MPKKLTDKKSKHHITTAVAVFFGLLLLLIIFVGALQITYAAKFLPNTYIGNVNVGGQSMARASLQLQEQIAKINQTGFKFSAGRETALVTPLVVSPNDPDQTYELVNWQLDENLRRIFSVSHQGPWWQRFTQLLGSLFSDSYFSMDVSVDRAAEAILRDNFGQLEKTVRPTSFSFTSTDVAVVPGEDGTKIDYESALNKLESVLAALDSQVINLEVQPDLVTVGAGQAQALLPQVKQVLINDGWQLNLSYFVSTREISYTWPLSKNQLQGWLEPKKDQTIYLGLGMEARAFLERIAAQVNRQAQDAKFEIAAGGHLAQFQNSAPGVELDIDESLRNIERGFIEGGDTSATLVVNTIAPRVETAQTNELGIAEILGVGKSNFAGSPANRIHNIRVSSDKLNGLLIAPSEEFSLVEALKPFTAEAGYRPELVIKGNKLLPEIGGGACQIGTTTFRAALSSGLEITQRRNHSFAVSYYNDENGLPGADATIYDPWPDFKFINNTPAHVLIQTHVEGDELIYEFWGTSDGRQASTTKPAILARQSAPPTNYIETTDLPVGTTSCSGSNVPGYTTTFTYTVVMPDGEEKVENFDSYYKPWQKICLVGVEKKESELVD